MRYVKDTPLELGHVVWQLRPPQPSLTILVKGTFDPIDGEPAALAAEQVLPGGESYVDDDVERALLRPTDFAVLKPQGELMIVGKAYTPARKPERVLACSFRCGAVRKQFVVVGDRRWEGGMLARPSEPEPFTEMELGLERAYGGAGHPPNPWGRGQDEVKGVRALPNLEQHGALIESPSSAPPPVIVGPRPQGLAARRSLGGTYDEAYLAGRWPWLPKDFDFRYFLESPPDQWIEGFWRGDEPFEVVNLHPSLATVRGRLPEIRPRVLISIRGETSDVPLRLDTVTWDAEAGKLLCVWRGIAEVPSETLEEIPHLFATHEPLAAPLTVAQLQDRLRALLAAETEEDAEIEASPPPPEVESDFDRDPPTQALPSPAGDAPAVPAAPPKAPAKPLPEPSELLERLRASGARVPPELIATLERLRDARAASLEIEPRTVFDPMAGPSVRERIKGRIEAGESLRGLDLSGADLARLDLGGRDLSGAILREAKLTGANLSGANLSRAVLAGADLEGAIARGANLKGADLSDAKATRADFAEASLQDATLDRAILRGADLRRAKAAKASFVRADLEEARLGEGNFAEADFERAKLMRVDAARAVLSNALLERADATGARFDGAEMKRVRAERLIATEAKLRAIVAPDSFWERARLNGVDFGLAKLDGADFSDAALREASFDGCTLRKARFDRADAHSARARRADLMGACFDSALLSNADLRGANLYSALMWRAKLDGARLDLANLDGTPLAR